MRHPRFLGLFSLCVLGILSVVTPEAGAAGKRPGPQGGSKAPAAIRSCKKAEPVVSTCAPNKVLLSPAVSSPYPEGEIKAMAAADVNGDGKTDLILSRASSSVQVMLSKGDGEFEEGAKIEDSVGGEGLVVTDFDGDCRPDILVSSFAGQGTPRSVNFYPGKGNGSFGPGVTIPISHDNPSILLPADINADGKPDFVYIGDSFGIAKGGPTFVLNSGRGKFNGPGITQDISGRFTVGDVTGDGAAEIVTFTTQDNKEVMCVHANKGNGQFDKPVCAPLSPSSRPLALAIADFNGDGKNDIVVACELLTMEGGTMFNVFLNNGDGTFDDRVPYTMPTPPSALTVADVNNDGKPDLVVYKGHTDPLIAFLKNKGDGTFSAKAERYPIGGTSGYPTEPLVTGDFNGNGLIGFATVDRNHHAVSVIAASCKP